MARVVCTWCGEKKPSLDFPRSKAFWFKDGVANVCTSCLERELDFKDLNQADKILQFLDIPFYPDKWIECYKANPEHTLSTYVTRFFNRTDRSDRMDWGEVNTKWLQKQKDGTLSEEIEVLNEDWMREMHEKWGDSYDAKDLHILDSLFTDVERTQNIVTALQREQAQNICRILLNARRKTENGEDASKEFKSVNDMIKAGGFEPKNARNYGEFESVGELINWLVRRGYKPKFYDGKDRDIVDLTIKNNQAYLRRLVSNEPGLSDLVQQRRDSYKIAQQLEDEGMDDASLEKYDDQGFAKDFEDEDTFMEEIGDDE